MWRRNVIKIVDKKVVSTVGLIVALSAVFYCIKSLNETISYKMEIQNVNNIYESYKAKIDVPLISQLPELSNGCEVTSLAMLLKYNGIDVDKIVLASQMKKDETKIFYDKYGDIKSWGNPECGFVGDVTRKNGMGYSINPKPLGDLIDRYYPKGALDLTGCNLNEIENILVSGRPIVAWVTCGFKENVNWVNWSDYNGNYIKATFSIHAVTLTGFDDEYIYYNDPLTNQKDKKITKKQFLSVWNMMGRKALSLQ